MPATRRVGLSVDYHLLYKHHTDLFAGIQRFADERGWLTVIDDWVEGTLASAYRAPYDGVIARVDANRVGVVHAAARLKVPVVNVMAGSPAYEQLPGVFPDFEQVGRLRAEHLLSRGLRKFGYLMGRGNAPERWQAEGFVAAVEEAGYQVTRVEMPTKWGDSLSAYQKYQATIHSWMDRWELPIGIGMATDVMARLTAQFCHQRGWRVPGDVAIVGGRNEEKLCEKPRPSLTSVEVGFERVGYEAARLLDIMMDDAERQRKRGKRHQSRRKSTRRLIKPIHTILPPVGVVVRESTDFFAVDDELVARAQAYIADQCHLHLEVDDVAEELAVSSRTLQNRFAATLKRSVAQEIRRVRIEKAKRELTGSELSVEEIATRAGFATNSRMCEVFRRELGMTPSQYREQRKITR